MARVPRAVRNNDLYRRAEALRSHLPFYLRFRDDTSGDPALGLEPEEVPDGYGMTEKDYDAF